VYCEIVKKPSSEVVIKKYICKADGTENIVDREEELRKMYSKARSRLWMKRATAL
jgi:hypothetical protein